MSKIILITGSTDGIGLETARILVEKGHHVLLHGRSEEKLQKVYEELSKIGTVERYCADCADLCAVNKLAQEVLDHHEKIDVLINNAGVLKAQNTITKAGYDVRFVVNTMAPYILMKHLFPSLGMNGRVINVSSSALSPVNIDALRGNVSDLDDLSVYSQSKFAITMLSNSIAKDLGAKGPSVVAIHPGSLLGSKMVKEGFGVKGRSLSIGSDVLVRASLSDEFAGASGKYFDNDKGRFCTPHADIFNNSKAVELEENLEQILSNY